MAKPLTQHKDLLPDIREGLTKKQIARLAAESVEHILEEGNVVLVAEALATMDEFAKTVRKDERYVQFLRDELAKHHGRLTTSSGARIESCEAAVQYNYAHSAEWQVLDEQIKMLQEQKKLVEEKLKKIAPGRMAVDPETGEVLEGALKMSRSTYRITLAR